jgi:hypothetical protein
MSVPSVKLTTAVAVLGMLACLAGAGVFLLTAGARGGEASQRLQGVEAKETAVETRVASDEVAAAAHEKEDAAIREKVAVHGSQIVELQQQLGSMDHKIDRILERLPPPSGK